MACPNPISIKAKFARKGQTHHHVPCGKCPKCIEEKRAQWTIRLKEQQRTSLSSHFLTLTYDESNIVKNDIGLETLNKEHLRDFSKLIKQDSKRQEKVQPTPLKTAQIKYYAIGEYGTETLRPHYHYIIFNIHPKTINRLQEIWNKGFVKVGSVTTKSIHYVTNYVNKKKTWPGEEYPGTQDEKEQMFQKPFSNISNGLGKTYLKNTSYHQKSMQPFMVQDGFKVKMPRYLKDKIYDKAERAVLQKTAIKLSDKKYMEYDLKYQKLGINPEKNRQEQYNKFIERFEKGSIKKQI